MRLMYADYRVLAKADALDDKFNVYIAKLGMEGEKFHACMKEDRVADVIAQQAEEATRFGVVMTPTYFIGDKPYMGVMTYENMKAQIDNALNVQ